ncbi:MAG: MaoC family dehydratase N-terminal domain-containing protein [Spirochaetes bacterium]|nr:MaoC family dehydratase N-terminal domain-containing protein [Spirochaetota bacterium]
MGHGPSLDSALAGIALRELATTVTWRDTMNYAAALGDGNPRYFDDERGDGIIAHPVFPVAVTWKILGRIWEFIDAGSFPVELLATQVHYTEHLAIHGPLTPGRNLVIRGDIAAILPHRAGTHVVLRLAARDEGGAAVFTEHIGAMLRGVECLGGGAGADRLPRVPAAPKADAPQWESPVRIDPLRPFVYDGCTDIFFPIHTSMKFARQVGLPGIILQGTATLALAVTELVNRELGGEPGRVRAVSCRFTGMVLPGTDISVRLLAKDESGGERGLFFEVRNGNGERAVSDGYVLAG